MEIEVREKKQKNIKKRVLIAVLSIVGILLIGVVAFFGRVLYVTLTYPNQVRKTEPVTFKPSREAAEMLTPQEMQGDLDELKRILFEVHPITEGLDETNDTTGLTQAFEKASKQVEKERSIGAFYYIVNEVMTTLEDGHTVAWGVQGEAYIEAELEWIEDRLYVLDSSFLHSYDEVIAIGGIPLDKVYTEAQKYIAAENEYAARRKFLEHIGTPNFLVACGVDEENLTITVQRDEVVVTVPMKTKKATYAYDPLPNQRKYTIDEQKKMCHFIMKTCDYDADYISLLNHMFTEIKEKGITTLVVDIRRNPGGNSMVCDELLRYLPVESYKGYGCDVRYSEEASKQNGYFLQKGTKHYESSMKQNKQYTDLLFEGEAYVLVDDVTFSSANWLGVVFQDTGAATIVGEPTTNNPNSYGDILSFQLPHSTIGYSVSHKKWVAANSDRESQDALIPDVLIKPTLEEAVRHEDVLMRWIEEQIK